MKHVSQITKYEYTNNLYDNYYNGYCGILGDTSELFNYVDMPDDILDYFYTNDTFVVSNSGINVKNYVENIPTTYIHLEKHSYESLDEIKKVFDKHYEKGEILFLFNIVLNIKQSTLEINYTFSGEGQHQEAFSLFKTSQKYKDYKKIKRIKRINKLLDGLGK